jgi:hypothetical protein
MGRILSLSQKCSDAQLNKRLLNFTVLAFLVYYFWCVTFDHFKDKQVLNLIVIIRLTRCLIAWNRFMLAQLCTVRIALLAYRPDFLVRYLFVPGHLSPSHFFLHHSEEDCRKVIGDIDSGRAPLRVFLGGMEGSRRLEQAPIMLGTQTENDNDSGNGSRRGTASVHFVVPYVDGPPPILSVISAATTFASMHTLCGVGEHVIIPPRYLKLCN